MIKMKKDMVLIIMMLLTKGLIGQASYSVKNLMINSEYSDFGVSFKSDGTVVYTSSKRNGVIKRSSKQPYLELFHGVVLENGEIYEKGSLSRQFDAKYHESNAIFTKDGKTVYFNRNNRVVDKFNRDAKKFYNIELFKVDLDEYGKWGQIQALPFNGDGYSVGHPALNADETYLYFISDMPGGFGSTDIYRVRINSDGTYESPENLGPTVNTPHKEMFPYISRDTLYFSSEGHNSMGGLDIFKVEIDQVNDRVPVGLGEPFNSIYDDFCFVHQYDMDNQESGYFSSNRVGGKGSDDIYFFAQNECSQRIRGKVTHTDSIGDIMVSLYDSHNILLDQERISADGTFSFLVDCEKRYRLIAGDPNGKDAGFYVETDGAYDKENQVQLSIQRPEPVKTKGTAKIDVGPIYFDSNSSIITEKTSKALDKVVAIMKKQPKLEIECHAHTDSQGDSHYNLWLSERRAFNVAKYLKSKGISGHRVTYMGFGETMPIIDCLNTECTESENQQNRRVEFVVGKPNGKVE